MLLVNRHLAKISLAKIRDRVPHWDRNPAAWNGAMLTGYYPSAWQIPHWQGVFAGDSMRVLAMASQKGGSGKTTLSGHLAVQAQRAGAGPVVLIDIDPQGSLSDWWNEREAEFPAFAQTTVARLAADLDVLRQQGFRLAVIDTPPAITMAIQSVIQVAELIVIPTRPSPHDLRAVGATVDLCDRAGKPLIFVVNAATPKAKITSEAAVALSQHGTVAPVTIHHRTDFAASMIDGRTVMEVDPKGRSAAEIESLWAYVSDRLEKNFRRTVFSAPATPAAPGMAASRQMGGFGRRVVS
jgi:chromosome partitioning protein